MPWTVSLIATSSNISMLQHTQDTDVLCAAPALQGFLAKITPWTVGLIATFTTVACVIAADTGAYFVGE